MKKSKKLVSLKMSMRILQIKIRKNKSFLINYVLFFLLSLTTLLISDNDFKNILPENVVQFLMLVSSLISIFLNNIEE